MEKRDLLSMTTVAFAAAIKLVMMTINGTFGVTASYATGSASMTSLIGGR